MDEGTLVNAISKESRGRNTVGADTVGAATVEGWNSGALAENAVGRVTVADGGIVAMSEGDVTVGAGTEVGWNSGALTENMVGRITVGGGRTVTVSEGNTVDSVTKEAPVASSDVDSVKETSGDATCKISYLKKY